MEQIAKLRQQMELLQLPALSIRLVRSGTSLFACDLGLSDIEAGTVLGGHHRFRLGCLTKPFVAQAVLELSRLGLLKLDDPISRFIPTLFDEITIDHLLTHASGLARGDYQLGPRDDEATLGKIAASRLHFTPGTKRKYSHWGYFLLGRVIAAVTGQAPEAFISRHVLHPLQLLRTSFDDEQRDLVTGYWSGWHFGTPAGDRRLERCTHVRIPACASGLVAPADDAIRWVESVVHGGDHRLLALRARKSYVYTLGGFAVDSTDHGVCYHFSAFSSGSSCFVFMIPSLELTGIALCNHQSGHHELRPLLSAVCREIIEGESLSAERSWNGARELGLEAEASTKSITRGVRSIEHPRVDDLVPEKSELVGRYHSPVLGLAEVKLDEGRLYIEYGDQSACELRPRHGLRFTQIRGPFRGEVVQFCRSSETGRTERLLLGELAFCRLDPT